MRAGAAGGALARGVQAAPRSLPAGDPHEAVTGLVRSVSNNAERRTSR